MKTPDIFLKKQNNLNVALLKIQAMEDNFKRIDQEITEQNNKGGRFYWTEEQIKKIEKWNNVHDLRYRIEERLWENYFKYQDWHFQTFQFSAYSF